MLEKMRRGASSGFSYLLVAILIVVFAVFFGSPADGCQYTSGPVRAATVHGDALYSDEVNLIFNRRYGAMQRQQDDEVIRGLRAQALKGLILINLLADRARDAGLRVTDEEFNAYMTDPLRNPEFGQYAVDGEISARRYQNYIRNGLRVGIPQYEEFKRQELLARKYLTLAEMQLAPLPFEIQQLRELRNTKVNLEYIAFKPSELAPFVEVSDENVRQFSSSAEEQIKAYYENNRPEYVQPQEVQIRRIYIPKPSAVSEDAEDATSNAAETFASAKSRVLEANEDFAEVARELTEDFYKEKGGLMDWTTLDNLDPAIASAVKDAAIGEVREVETDFAYMLVKLEDRKAEKKTELEEVRLDIARRLLQQEKVNALIEDLAQKLRTQAGAKTSLSEALSSFEPSNSEDQGPEATPTEVSPGDAEKLNSPWQALKVSETGLFSLEGQNSLAQFGGQLPPQLLQQFTSWETVPGIGKNRELALDAFRLSESDPMPNELYSNNGTKYLIRLKDKKMPEEADAAAGAKEVDPAADAPAEEEEQPAGDPDQALATEIRAERVSALLRGHQSLFIFPSEELGPWLENIYQNAVDSGDVELNEDSEISLPLLQKDLEPPTSDVLDVQPASSPKENAEKQKPESPSKPETGQ